MIPPDSNNTYYSITTVIMVEIKWISYTPFWSLNRTTFILIFKILKISSFDPPGGFHRQIGLVDWAKLQNYLARESLKDLSRIFKNYSFKISMLLVSKLFVRCLFSFKFNLSVLKIWSVQEHQSICNKVFVIKCSF